MNDLEPYRLLSQESSIHQIELWKALDLRIGRAVFVEIAPRPEGWSDARLALRLRAASELRHAALLTALDVGFDAERMFAVYPCFEAASVERPEALAVKDALRTTRDLARGLAEAHRRGLLHGDLGARWIVGDSNSQRRLLGIGIPRDPQAEAFPCDRGRSLDLAALAHWLQLSLRRSFDQSSGLSKAAERDLQAVLHAAQRGVFGGGYTDAEAFADDLTAVLKERPVSVRPRRRIAVFYRHLVRARGLVALAAVTVSLLLAGAFLLGILMKTREESVRAAEWQRLQDLEARLEQGFLLLAEDRIDEAYSLLQARDFGPFEAAAAWGRALAQSRGVSRSEAEGSRIRYRGAPLPTRGLEALATSFALHPFEDTAAEIAAALRETQLAIALGGPGVRLAWIARGRLSLSDPSWSESFTRDVLRLFPEDDRLLAMTLRTDPNSAIDIEARAASWLADPRRSLDLRRAALKLLAQSLDSEHRQRVEDALKEELWLTESDRQELRIQLALKGGEVDALLTGGLSVDLETAPVGLFIAYGRALLAARRSEEAIALAEKGTARWPQRRELELIRLAAIEQRGRGRDLAPYRALVRSWPGALGPRAILGRRAFAIGAYAEGLTAIAGGIPWQSSFQTPYSDIAFGLLELGRAAEARPWIAAARQRAGDLPILQLYEARALARLGRKSEALAKVRALGDEPAKDPHFRRIRGLLLARDLSDRAAAAADLDAAHALDPSHREVGVQRVLGLQAAGKNEAAFEALKLLLEHHPEDPWILTRLGDLARATGKGELRRGYLERAAEARPKEASLQSALALECDRQGDPEGALRAHLAGLERDPWSAEAWCNLGLFYEKRNALKEAVRCLRRGHALGFRRTNWRYPSATWLSRCETKLAQTP